MDNESAELIKQIVKDEGNTIGVFNQKDNFEHNNIYAKENN